MEDYVVLVGSYIVRSDNRLRLAAATVNRDQPWEVGHVAATRFFLAIVPSIDGEASNL